MTGRGSSGSGAHDATVPPDAPVDAFTPADAGGGTQIDSLRRKALSKLGKLPAGNVEMRSWIVDCT